MQLALRQYAERSKSNLAAALISSPALPPSSTQITAKALDEQLLALQERLYGLDEELHAGQADLRDSFFGLASLHGQVREGSGTRIFFIFCRCTGGTEMGVGRWRRMRGAFLGSSSLHRQVGRGGGTVGR